MNTDAWNLFNMDPEKNERWLLGGYIRFNYIAYPTPYVAYVLEEEYGPLDYNAPYI